MTIERRGTGAPAADWYTRLSMELRRDKKKTAILAALVLVGAVMGGRMLVGGSPSRASAKQRAAPTAKISPTPLAILGTGASSEGSACDKYIAAIKPGITRDLFRLTPELFPLTEPTRVVDKPKPTTRPVKPDKDALKKKRTETVKAGVRSQARRQLNVQSTIVGDSPMAIINGKLLRIGDQIAGFTLVAVGSRTCEVQKTVEYRIDPDAETTDKLVIKARIEIKGLRPGTGSRP